MNLNLHVDNKLARIFTYPSTIFIEDLVDVHCPIHTLFNIRLTINASAPTAQLLCTDDALFVMPHRFCEKYLKTLIYAIFHRQFKLILLHITGNLSNRNIFDKQ